MAVLLIFFLIALSATLTKAPGVRDVGAVVAKVVIALGAFGWVLGMVVQLFVHGTITEPCCQ